MSDGRDPVTGRLQPGHAVRPAQRGGPSEAELIRKKLAPHREAILEKVISLALQGDPRSAELALRYLAPAARPDAERVVIPHFAESATLEEKARAVLEAAAAGHCSAEAAQKLLSVLDLYQRTVTATDMERRLQAIEAGRVVPQALPQTDIVDVEIC